MYGFLKGDWHFFYLETIKNLSHLPSGWDSFLNTGIGMPESTPWITTYLQVSALFGQFLPWAIVTLVLWVIPIFAIGFLSALFLFRFLFPEKSFLPFIASIIYTTNTYFLLAVGGGQMGVAFAYSLVPFLILFYFKLFKKPSLKNALLTGLVFSLQMFSDPRIVFLALLIIILYMLWNVSLLFKQWKKITIGFFVSFAVTFLIHSFWLLPLLLYRQSLVPNGFTNVANVKFFSFADFSHAFSLLHPNWPENIFGKVYFMQPEFLVLPMLVYCCLLFLKNAKTKGKNILFFALTGLAGVFLAKGINDPFGNVYFWLYIHVPGFAIFRDATKFYVFVALSYAILVPHSLEKLSEKISASMHKFHIKVNIHTTNHILLATFLLFWIFLIRQIFVGPIFKPYVIPQQYIALKNFLAYNTSFSRTLWIPSLQRYGYFSDLHPAIGRGELFSSSQSAVLRELQQPQTEMFLQDLSIKYVIVPYDSEGEIFTSDRKYDEKQYQKMLEGVRRVSYLHEVKDFGKIAVFELSGQKDHFWLSVSRNSVSYTKISPTQYLVKVKNSIKGNKLVFSEGFNKNWQAQIGSHLITSTPYARLINSFTLPDKGNDTVTVSYKPQRLENIGLIISIITFITVIISILVR